MTEAAPSVLVMARSAEEVTTSTSVAESFATVGSATGDDVIVAVFVTVAETYAGGSANVSMYATDVPTPSGADVVQVKTPATIAQSGSVSAALVPAGIGSEMTTPAGSTEGPLFVSVIV